MRLVSFSLFCHCTPVFPLFPSSLYVDKACHCLILHHLKFVSAHFKPFHWLYIVRALLKVSLHKLLLTANKEPVKWHLQVSSDSQLKSTVTLTWHSLLTYIQCAFIHNDSAQVQSVLYHVWCCTTLLKAMLSFALLLLLSLSTLYCGEMQNIKTVHPLHSHNNLFQVS